MIYEFNGKAPKIDKLSFISETAVLIGDVVIGPGCYVGPSAVIRADCGKIILEDHVAVEDGVIIHAIGPQKEFVIGSYVTIGHGAIVHADYIAPYANIGMGAVVSIGSFIGQYAIVAEGAVVSKGHRVEDKTVVGGVPAKCLRVLSDNDIRYWNGNKAFYVRLTEQCMKNSLKRID